MLGIPCPKYFKSVTFHNKAAGPFAIAVSHESGKSYQAVIQPNEQRTFYEVTTDESCQYVDPIKSLRGHESGHPQVSAINLTSENAEAIEVRRYEIQGNFVAIRVYE